jgi:hypothetical protein
MTESMQDRLKALQADHALMELAYEKLRHIPLTEEQKTNMVDLPPAWQRWYEQFTEIKDRMYQLAYNLGIPFKTGVVGSDDYAQTWDAVQTALSLDGNRREFRLEDQMTPGQRKEYTNRVRGRWPSGKAIK